MSNLKTGGDMDVWKVSVYAVGESGGLARVSMTRAAILSGAIPEGNREGDGEMMTAQELWQYRKETERGHVLGSLYSEMQTLEKGSRDYLASGALHISKYYEFWKSWEVERFALRGQ